MMQEAVAAEPKNIAYRDSLGWALVPRGPHRRGDGRAEKGRRVATNRTP